MQMNMNVFGKVLPLQSVLVDFSVVVVDLAKPKNWIPCERNRSMEL